jgi:hypothetical protein
VDEHFYSAARERVNGKLLRYSDEEFNAGGLTDWERDVVSRYVPAGCRVAITGAGAGREVIGLLEMGYDAIGCEPHDGLREAGVELLEARGHQGRLVAARRDEVPPGLGSAQCVLVGWGSYMLIPGALARITFLRSAYEALPLDGTLLLSFFVRSRADGYLRLVAAVGSAIRRLRGRGPVELGDALGPNYVHFFSRAEIETELKSAGFELVHFAAEPYGHAVARRR